MSKPKVLIAFYSRNSSTELLAKAVAQGAMAEGAEAVSYTHLTLPTKA